MSHDQPPLPLRYLARVGRQLPDFWRKCGLVLDGHRAAMTAQAASDGSPFAWIEDGRMPFQVAREVSNLYIPDRPQTSGEAYLRTRLVPGAMTLWPWRLTQNIFRFDPDLAAELSKTRGLRKIPVSLFSRLPQWAVYVEAPVRNRGIRYDGFFAAVCPQPYRRPLFNGATEYGWEDPLLALYFLKDEPGDGSGRMDEETFLLSLEDGDVGRSLAARYLQVNREYQESPDAAALGLVQVDDVDAAVESALEEMGPILSMLLYLCSEEPDGDIPARAVPSGRLHRKSGETRYHAADRPLVSEVGYRFGAAFRAQRAAASAGEGVGSPRAPHVRSAHWHTFLAGPRDAERERRVRWLPPIFVNAKMGDAIPAVIRPTG